MCCNCCCGNTLQKVCVFGFGLVLATFGLVGVLYWETWADDILFDALPLTPTSRTFDKWAITPIPIYAYMYLFNWTNPEDVIAFDVKPSFEQMGPYVFREERSKEDLVWHDNNTVTFHEKRTWFHEPALSNGSLDDPITCPHLPSIAASNIMRNKPRVVKKVFNRVLNQNGGSLYQTHTANEWLFQGFYDPFLNYSMRFNNSNLPPIESDQFAWFLGRNGSKEFEGDFTIHTGRGDLSQMGDLKFWKGQNQTGFYEGNCGRINGSTSDLWVPNRAADEFITIFITDTCRIINLVPTNQNITIEGVSGVKYETKPDTFDNGQRNSKMKCYCPVDRQPDNCPKSGATDIGRCTYGAPVYLSHAHFMYADPSYTDTYTVKDFKPDSERDGFFIIMEPKLGIPLQVNGAVQMSVHLRRDKDIKIFKDIPDFYAPLFIMSMRALMSAELAKEIKFALNLPSLGRNISIGVLSLGCLLLVIGTCLTITKNWHGQKMKEMN